MNKQLKLGILLLSLLGIFSVPNLPIQAENYRTPMIVDQLLGNFTQVLEISRDILELGNSLSVSYGVLNDTLYFPGLIFNLSLQGNDADTLLLNGTTSPFKSEFIFDSKEFVRLSPGDYNFLYEVNTTTQILNATAYFSIITKAGASISINVKDLDDNSFGSDIYPEVLETKNIMVILSNFGSSNAYNIIFSYLPINEPVGLQSNTSQSITLPILASLEEHTVNFTITPQDYGLGEVQMNLDYTDGEGVKSINSKTINVYTIPNSVDIDLKPPDSMIVSSSDKFTVRINNFQSIDLTLIITLSSDAISFVQQSQQLDISRGIEEITFIGTVGNVSAAKVKLEVVFFDLIDGQDVIQLLPPITRTVLITASIKIPQFSFTEFLMGILIFFNSVGFVVFILIVFRKDIRRKFFKRFLRMNYVPDLEFPNHSIIVDGSNIAWEETSKKGKPQMKNITLCMERLKEYRFENITVVADAALRYQLDSPDELDEKVKQGAIKVLPAKVNGDSFILRLSSQEGSLILSNDLFREFRDDYPFIDDRRVPYTILNGQFFLHPIYKKKVD